MIIEVQVKLKSCVQKVQMPDTHTYRVALTALPIKGQANEELIDVLSGYFQIPKSMIYIKSGKRNKIKIIELRVSK